MIPRRRPDRSRAPRGAGEGPSLSDLRLVVETRSLRSGRDDGSKVTHKHERTRTMGKLSGKVALVTGGASGIGRAIAGALAAEGADIGIVDRNAAGARTAAEETARLGVRAIAASADVGDEAEMAPDFGAATAALRDVAVL